MARRSALSSPAKVQVQAVASLYGALSSTRPGSPASAARARAWVLVDPDGDPPAGRLVVYRRPPGGGVRSSVLERVDLGAVAAVAIVGPGRALPPEAAGAQSIPASARTALASRAGALRWAVELTSGEVVTATAAPCTCGAGNLGFAGPVDGPHSVTYVRPDPRVYPWLVTAG